MRALVIGTEQQEAIDRLIELARSTPISLADVEQAKIAQGEALTQWKRRLDPYTIPLPVGYLVTYTHEQQPVGLCRHISISVDAPGMITTPEAVAMICTAFKMEEATSMVLHPVAIKPGMVFRVWPEEYSNGRVAVNIIVRAAEEPA